ncbi:MAG: M23 family metallopeptidase [Flavobacteriaceae bacterium]|nr:M23 family metallopeptidase [Flavobacteriaceae bacterium]
MAFYFFTEPSKLLDQTSTQGFGAIDEENYRLGNMFAANPSDEPKAFAVINGSVLVQQIGASDKYSIILKPSEQPDLGLPKIDFIIYKGIKKDSIIDGEQVKIPSSNENEDHLIRNIYDSLSLYETAVAYVFPDEPDAATSLGFAYSSVATETALQKADTDFLNDVFYTNDGITLPVVKSGDHIGNFDSSGDFEILIIFEKIGYQPTFSLARELDSKITFTALAATASNADTFERKHEKEQVLAFIDSAAFFGAFSTLGLQVYNGSEFVNKTGDSLYTDVISKHINRNKIYLDIRNEYDDSFNYYENYDNTVRWSLDNTDTLVDVEYDRNHEWPILVIEDSQFNVVAGDNKTIQLSLPNADNEFPLIYLKRAFREDLGIEALPETIDKFLTPITIANVTLANYVRLNQNLIIPQSNDLVFSNYFLIKYIKRTKVDDDDGSGTDTNNPTSGYSLHKRVYLDNLFPIFDMHIPFQNTDYTNLKVYQDVSHIDKLLVKDIAQANIVGDYTLRDYTSSIGVAQDPDYVTFISFPFTYNNNVNLNDDVLPLSTMEMGNNNPFLIELNSLISSVDLVRSEFTNNGQTVGFLKFINNTETTDSTFTSTDYTFNDVIILSLTTQQNTALQTLKDTNFPDGYKIYLGVKDITPIISGGNTYFSFELVLRGLRSQNDEIETHVVDSGIIAYTDAQILGIDSGHVFPVSQAYIEEDFGERTGGRHKGIDIETTSDATTPGSPVYAARGGTVERIIKATNNGTITAYLTENGGTDNNAAGIRVRILGDNGYYYYYFHLAPGTNDHLNIGDVVAIGDQIGEIGLSGEGNEVNSPAWTQYHLHFEIWSGTNYRTDKVSPYTVFPELALLPFDTHRND